MFNQQEITKIVQVLASGGVVVHPTDTVWGIAADAFNENAVNKIFTLKNRPKHKKLILLLDSTAKLDEFTLNIPTKAKSILEYHVRPITIIYENVQKLPEYLLSPDKSIAIRLVRDEFCQAIIKELGRPIVSTSANFSEAETPINFEDIDPKFIQSVDYTAKYRRNTKSKHSPSVIAKISKENELIILRN